MAKYPSEIFGCYLRNTTAEAEVMREKHWCPFHESTCYKQSRLIEYPFGFALMWKISLLWSFRLGKQRVRANWLQVLRRLWQIDAYEKALRIDLE